MLQVSISPIFYEQFFRTIVFFCAAFMCLQFGFVIFCRQDFGAKATHKMLVKLTPGLLRCQMDQYPNRMPRPRNTKGGSITVLLTSCLTGLD